MDRMSHEPRTSIDFDAPPEPVWETLVDLGMQPTGNPFITRVDGVLRVGGRLTLAMQPAGARPARLRPALPQVTSGRRPRWRGRTGVRGAFDADHRSWSADARTVVRASGLVERTPASGIG
jgi:hypothetical protein